MGREIGIRTRNESYRVIPSRWAGLLFGLLLSWGLAAQQDILDVRHRPLGSVVSFEGIVLNGEEMGIVRYVQDSTAGIAVYPGGSSPASFTQTKTGDRIQVSGVLTNYHGLLEINPVLSWQLLSQDNSVPEPQEIQPGALTPDDQGKLIRIRCGVFRDTPARFAGGNHPFHTPEGVRAQLYLDGNNPIVNAEIPMGAVDLIAISSYFDGERFLVRSVEDMIPSGCFYILPEPVQSHITPEGFEMTWYSSEPGNGYLTLKTLNGLSDTLISSGGTSLAHGASLEGLLPAEFYELRAGAVSMEGDSVWYPGIIMSTASLSSGKIRVYFTRSVDTSYSTGGVPDGTSFTEMHASVMDIIGDAMLTIDVAMYNSNRSDIIAALEQAQGRGVRVRMIADAGQSNGALDPLPDFPVMFRGGEGIMHHKFIAADAEDTDRATVWTGSTNHSTNQLSTDPNNTVVIQDQALARAYVMEFEEMWGGSGELPNSILSRTGSEKRDDTPHLFNVGGKRVESFFSPSDHTNARIRLSLQNADETINAALLLLTRSDLTAVMTEKVSQGVTVRVIIEDLNSSATNYQALLAGGAWVVHHDYNAIFHHKYALIDDMRDQARVITGSHNWTTSATTINDENTLIIHDPIIANLFRQEFEARWGELNPTAIEQPDKTSDIQFFPNPVDSEIWFAGNPGLRHVWIADVAGRICMRPELHGNALQVSLLAPGLYSLIFETNHGVKKQIPFIKR